MPLNDRWTAVGQALASMLLLASGLWLPWAIYQSQNLSLSFRTGWLDLILVVSGAVALGLVTLSLIWNHSTVQCFLLATGCVAVITSVAFALTKIKEANDTAGAHAAGFSQTSYGIGSVLGVAASLLLIVLSVIQFSRVRSRRGQLRTDSGTERVRGSGRPGTPLPGDLGQSCPISHRAFGTRPERW